MLLNFKEYLRHLGVDRYDADKVRTLYINLFKDGKVELPTETLYLDIFTLYLYIFIFLHLYIYISLYLTLARQLPRLFRLRPP